MELFYIILLVFLGLLFLVAELVLLPGVSVGAILAMACYGGSIYLAFRKLFPGDELGDGIDSTFFAMHF